MQEGDTVVLATDGLWDNCYNEEVVRVIRCADKETSWSSFEGHVLDCLPFLTFFNKV